MKRSSTIEHLANGFYDFLRDSSTFGGSHIADTPLPDTVSHDIVGYHIEAKFTDKYQCELTIKGTLELEELISVPYNKSFSEPKPNWKRFYKGIFILIRERSQQTVNSRSS